MHRQPIYYRALAVLLTLGGSLHLPAYAGRELSADEVAGGIQPINAVEPLVLPVQPQKKWRLDGTLSATAVYNDNIFISSSGKTDDFIFSISPSFLLTLGAPNSEAAGYLTLHYAPAFVHYAEHSDLDALNHAALFTTGYRFSRLSVGMSLGYQKGREADAEVGTLVDRKNYSAALTSRYQLTDRSSVDLSLSKSFSDYEGFLDVSDTVLQGHFNTKITEAITLGVGLAHGSAEASGSSARSYQQLTVRGAYTATERLVVTANAGGDFRDGQFSPIFGLGANYKPFDSTEVAFTGSRSILPSAVFVDQDRAVTSFFASVRQRFLQRYFLTPSVGYDQTEYRGSGDESRSDSALTFGLSAATNLTERWGVQVFYQYRRNTSTVESFTFTNQQIGVSSSISF